MCSYLLEWDEAGKVIDMILSKWIVCSQYFYTVNNRGLFLLHYPANIFKYTEDVENT